MHLPLEHGLDLVLTPADYDTYSPSDGISPPQLVNEKTMVSVGLCIPPTLCILTLKDDNCHTVSHSICRQRAEQGFCLFSHQGTEAFTKQPSVKAAVSNHASEPGALSSSLTFDRPGLTFAGDKHQDSWLTETKIQLSM